eukprot:CAMPEP_0116893880 /NCGR_PEP_ID=MMETSP0467-20121206/3774_1 /TAXON_ID=283647 /ORGANISM="Mesodinium pulex, Strain SPMC105" /LENGTH=145 /DNA_ID=CAMNT_0004563793 /DNA_START=2629 /DNA_END=3066 /DNA_ORIENTATION=+
MEWVHKVDKNLPNEELESVLSRLDVNSNRMIDVDEFVNILTHLRIPAQNIELKKYYDLIGNEAGTISRNDLRQFYQHIGFDTISMNEINLIFMNLGIPPDVDMNFSIFNEMFGSLSVKKELENEIQNKKRIKKSKQVSEDIDNII